MADDTTGLQVIDISDPSNPNITGNVDTPGNAYNVYVSGNYAYVADNNSGLQRSEERRVGKEGRSRWSPYH